MLECPICGDWVIIRKLCIDCDKIRQLCKLYGKDKLLEVLDKTMIIQQLKNNCKNCKDKNCKDKNCKDKETDNNKL